MKKNLLLIITLLSFTIMCPKVSALSSNALSDIEFTIIEENEKTYLSASLILNDDFIVNASNINIYGFNNLYIDMNAFKVVDSLENKTIDTYLNGNEIKTLEELPKETKLLYVTEINGDLLNKKADIDLEWKNKNNAYYIESLQYKMTETDDTLEVIEFSETTNFQTFLNTLNKKYPYIYPAKGSFREMTFVFDPTNGQDEEDTTITVGSINFDNKSLEDLHKEMDALVTNMKKEAPKNGILKSSILNGLKDNKMTATYEVKNEASILYAWTFDGAKINQNDNLSELNLNISLNQTKSQEAINSLVPASLNYLTLEFMHNGAVPNGTNVKIFIGNQFKENDLLDLYYYNSSTNQLEKVEENVIVKDGYASFNLSHCSEYVLIETGNTTLKNDNNVQTSSIDIVLYSIISLSALLAFGYTLKCKTKEL